MKPALKERRRAAHELVKERRKQLAQERKDRLRSQKREQRDAELREKVAWRRRLRIPVVVDGQLTQPFK
jgi:hypothetical protein